MIDCVALLGRVLEHLEKEPWSETQKDEALMALDRAPQLSGLTVKDLQGEKCVCVCGVAWLLKSIIEMQKGEALMALDRVSGLTVIDLHGGGHLCVAIGVNVLKEEHVYV